MSEIKGQLLGIAAVICAFGIVSSAIFLAFDTLANDLADDITETVEYKVDEENTSNLSFNNYYVVNQTTELLTF